MPLSRDTLFILMSLAASSAHGYAIMKDVEDRSDGEVILQAGALYRILKRLLGEGLIAECAPPADAEDDPSMERRRYYEITRSGRRVLEQEVDRLAQLVRAAKLSLAGKRPRLA